VLSKRQRAKKTRLQQGGSLSFQEAKDLLAENEVDEQIKEETRYNSRRIEGAELRVWHCGVCGNTGHNAQTCQVIVVPSEEDDSE
jgi:rubrerythrin